MGYFKSDTARELFHIDPRTTDAELSYAESLLDLEWSATQNQAMDDWETMIRDHDALDLHGDDQVLLMRRYDLLQDRLWRLQRDIWDLREFGNGTAI